MAFVTAMENQPGGLEDTLLKKGEECPSKEPQRQVLCVSPGMPKIPFSSRSQERYKRVLFGRTPNPEVAMISISVMETP